MQRILILLITLLTLSLMGQSAPARAADDAGTFKAITEASVFNHILPGYERLAKAGRGLEAAATAYCQDRTVQTFSGLDSSFRAYWLAWAGIRHIQFGPEQFLDRGFRIQFWPDTRNKIGKQLSRILAAQDTGALEQATFSRTSIAVQGLPALERLMQDGNASFSGPNGAFKCALTTTIARNLAIISQGIMDNWNPTDGYAHAVSMAGTGEGPYAEAYEVPVELLQSLIGELEASSDLRLGRPLGSAVDKARPKLAEAWRSGLSKAILVESLKGTEDLYLNGGFDKALKDAGEAELSGQITKNFQAVIKQASALDASLYDAFTAPDKREKLQEIRAALKTLADQIGTNLAVALDISPGFNSRDGD